MRADLVRTFSVLLILVTAPLVAFGEPAKTREASKISAETMRYLEDGSRYYVQHEYREAIGPYTKALDLEKKHPTLDHDLWRVLIDNLGMAYGISGDLAAAKVTFEYGLSKDATYPMFYYNLACTYAEMNDLNGAIDNLRLAFRYRDNMIRGERMPDPAVDDSFQRFLKNERFVAVLREIRSGRSESK